MGKDNKTINSFLKTIKNASGSDHVVFDYEAIYNDPAFVFFIVSERGSKGKSTQGKFLAKRNYLKGLGKTAWLMNTRAQIEKEKKNT